MKKILSCLLAVSMVLINSITVLAANVGEEFIFGAESFTPVTGTWNTSTNSTGIHYNDFGYYSVGNNASANISVTLPYTGDYDIYWFFSGVEADAGNCTLKSDNMNIGFRVNTKTGWENVGKSLFNEGNTVLTFTTDGQSRYSGIKLVYAGESLEITSGIYTVNNSLNVIYDIPYTTTVNDLLENITIPKAANVQVLDFDGFEKFGVIEDSDKLVADIDGEKKEYYLKTYTDGVLYSDKFNYRDYEQYMQINNLINDSENPNSFSQEDKVTSSIENYKGSNMLAMKVKPIYIDGIFFRANKIGFETIKDKVVVEYDIIQRGLTNKQLWIMTNAHYENETPRPDKMGYSLWSSRINARGTLMRDPSYGAMWLSFEDEPLLMDDERVYSVRQIIDFDGEIITYINGVKASVTNETLTQDIIPAVKDWTGMTSIEFGINTEKDQDWTGSAPEIGVYWDNVKVYSPTKYAEYFINLLPEESESAPDDLTEKIEYARNAADEMFALGITESEISNYDKLLYWENALTSINLTSDIYDIDNENHTVRGVLDGQTVSEFLSYINFASAKKYSVEGKSEEDIIENDDKLFVDTQAESQIIYNITVDKTIAVIDYKLDGENISQIPYNTSTEEFLKKIIRADAAEAKIYTGETENTQDILDNDILLITLGDNEYTFNLSVIPASSENYIIDAGNYEIGENTISNIPYGTYFKDLKKVILISEYAKVVYPYSEDYEGQVFDGDKIYVIAQNGEKREYLLNVDSGSVTSILTGKDGINVDAQQHIISGFDKGIGVNDFLSKLSASDYGRIKLYTKQFKEKTDGVITGDEIVKVTPQDPQPLLPYDIYVLSPNSVAIGSEPIIVTVNDNGFTTTSSLFTSGDAVEPGYNGITSVYGTSGIASFTHTITEGGEYTVYIYTSYHSSNKDYSATVRYENGTETASVAQSQSSGWKKLGTYKMNKGTDCSVEIDMSSLMPRLSAVMFEKTGEMFNINTVEISDSDEHTEELKEGLNNNNIFGNVVIKCSADAVISADAVSIYSENGNKMSIDVISDENEITITPQYPIRETVTYYLNINSSNISRPYTYVLSGKNNEIEAAAQISYYDKNNVIMSDSKNAQYANVNAVLENTTQQSQDCLVIICYYTDTGKIDKCIIKQVSVEAQSNVKVNETLEFGTLSENGMVKVFVWHNDLTPVTNIYYK